MHSSSQDNVTAQAGKSPDMNMSCSVAIAKVIFGMLEGAESEDLFDTWTYSCSRVEILDSTTAGIPSIANLRDIIRVADFHNFNLLPRLLKVSMLEVSDLGGYYALSVAVIADDLKNLKLLRHAVESIRSKTSPIAYEHKVARALGFDIWWSLVQAYHSAIASKQVVHCHPPNFEFKEVGVYRRGDDSQWRSIAESIRLIPI
jgi:hypothetical protein